MSTSPTSGRFIPLSTHYLETQGEGYETTLPSLLERSEQLAEEAREALPYSFDECTYSKGYLRQSVWSCIDCGEKGVCYGCSISCHAEHKLVELWTKRHFRCDCPTTSIPEVDGKRRKCTLNPPEAQPQQPNEENKYGTTFSGKFCRCGRDYDPETEVEAMVTCIGCEDWFHESCLNLIQPKDKVEEAVPDDEDEEKDVLIPSETYDGLICAACVNQHPLLVEHAGSEGWMIIEPDINGGFEVVGRPMPLSSKDPVDKGSDLEEIRGDADREQEQVSSPTTGDTRKRSADDADVESNKRARQELQVPPTAVKRECQGKGDIFLAHGIRSVLQTTLPTDVAASLPFPLEDQDIYEPPQDNDQEETLEEVTSRVVGSLPRVQAIEALHGYQLMKDKLKSMLASHAQDGRAVSKDDIEGFFAQLQAGKRGI